MRLEAFGERGGARTEAGLGDGQDVGASLREGREGHHRLRVGVHNRMDVRAVRVNGGGHRGRRVVWERPLPTDALAVRLRLADLCWEDSEGVRGDLAPEGAVGGAADEERWRVGQPS